MGVPAKPPVETTNGTPPVEVLALEELPSSEPHAAGSSDASAAVIRTEKDRTVLRFKVRTSVKDSGQNQWIERCVVQPTDARRLPPGADTVLHDAWQS